MENCREIIKSFTKDDYENGRVNLHIHTAYSDGLGEFSDICSQAGSKYKYFAITDHNTVQGHIDHPDCGAITGVEFDVWYKYIFLHLLAYGFDINNEAMKEFYSKDKAGTEKDILRIFAKRDIKKLINTVHDAGGIAVLAHPACCWALSMESFVKDLAEMGLDGLEVYYPYPRWRKYLKFSHPDTIEKLADRYNLIKTGGTDCHTKVLN